MTRDEQERIDVAFLNAHSRFPTREEMNEMIILDSEGLRRLLEELEELG